MVNANELRIGNFVLDPENKIVCIDEICNDGIGTDDRGWGELPLYSGIPLTEEWLLKFGFEKIERTRLTLWWYKDEDHFNIAIEDGYWWLQNYDGTIKKLEFVHQLQNLYFALTGTELTPNSNERR